MLDENVGVGGEGSVQESESTSTDQVSTGGEGSSTSSAPAAGDQTGPNGGSNADAPEGTTNVAAPGEAPKYVPNFKFKVMDKEHEIPEWARPAIKDAETEKQARETWEKALGLDVVKPRLKETQEKFKELHGVHSQLLESIQGLRECVSTDNFEDFFSKLKIPEEKVLQYFVNKAKYQELPPEQRNVLDARKEAERRAQDAEKRAQELESRLGETDSNALGLALNFEMGKPEIKSFADAYDAKVGKPGAFREAVCDVGELAWHKSQGKTLIPPEQAIREVMSRHSYLAQSAQAPTPGAAASATGGTQTPPTTRQEPPVIPNVGSGRNTSAMKAKPKSIEDLKKLYNAIPG